MRNALATALAAAAALGAVALATEGLRVYTSEAARRLAIERTPRSVPPVALEDARGRTFESTELSGRRLVVGFIYTRCPGVCRRVGSDLAALAAALPPEAGASLLSVSFDPERDTAGALAAYASQHDADGERWRIARPLRAEQLAEWLETFGIVVIPDGFGGFEHNAALHLVDERGRLVRILDLGAVEEALRFLREAPGTPAS
jgi:protein SCO1/2